MGILSIFTKNNTIYFPGCTTFFKSEMHFELYKRIFSKLGINFALAEKQSCCGLELLEAGYESEARKLALKNFKFFKEQGFENIITNSPECYKMFSQNYLELLPDWDIEVKNIWEMILNKIKYRPFGIKYKAMEIVTLHDSCYLGRYSGIYDEIREILELIGYQVKEMNDSKENSICCGSCGGLPISNLDLANKIARQRILQAKRIGVKKIIVTSTDNYNLLKQNSEDTEIEVLELSEVLAMALGIKKRKLQIEDVEERISEEDQILLDVESNIKLKQEIEDESENEEYDFDGSEDE